MARNWTKTIEVDGLAVEITRKRMKRLILRLDPVDGHARVSCPRQASDLEVIKFVRSKRDWIAEHQEQRASSNVSRLRECVTGEEFYLWGKTLPLEVVMDTRFSLAIHMDRFGKPSRAVLYVPPASTPDERRAWLREWYKDQVESVAAELLPKWEERMQLYSSHASIRWMKTRWGSCSVKTRRIRLNSQLAKFSPECLEYVIIHELAHIAVPNHGPEFQALMDMYCPDWQSIKQELNTTDFAYFE